MQRLLIIFLLFISSACAQKKERKININEIVKEFYGIYNNKQLDYPYVTFEKRKDGWYVVTQVVNGDRLDPVKKFLFYSNSEGQYKSIPFEKNLEKKDINVEDNLNEFFIKGFNQQLYYGYKGWYKDVIEELKDKNDLSDRKSVV